MSVFPSLPRRYLQRPETQTGKKMTQLQMYDSLEPWDTCTIGSINSHYFHRGWSGMVINPIVGVISRGLPTSLLVRINPKINNRYIMYHLWFLGLFEVMANPCIFPAFQDSLCFRWDDSTQLGLLIFVPTRRLMVHHLQDLETLPTNRWTFDGKTGKHDGI